MLAKTSLCVCKYDEWISYLSATTSPEKVSKAHLFQKTFQLGEDAPA